MAAPASNVLAVGSGACPQRGNTISITVNVITQFILSGIEPGQTAAQLLDAQLALPEVEAMEIGDLQFAAG